MANLGQSVAHVMPFSSEVMCFRGAKGLIKNIRRNILIHFILFIRVLCCLELIESLSKNGMSAGGTHKNKESKENVRHRSANGSANREAASEEKDYTQEQLQAVKK